MTTQKKVISRPNRKPINREEALVRIRTASTIAVQNTIELVAKRKESKC